MSSELPSLKAKKLVRGLVGLGFAIARTRGSHRFLRHNDDGTTVFSFHDRETVRPRMLAKVLKDAGVTIAQLRQYL